MQLPRNGERFLAIEKFPKSEQGTCMQFAGPVEGENVSEDVRVAVKEVLFVVLVVEELLLVGSEQSLREFSPTCFSRSRTDGHSR